MSKKETVVLGVLLVALIGMNAYQFARRELGKKGAQLVVEQGTIAVSINRATRGELEELPGIGPVLADRILRYREENKGFRTLEELQDVKGIGPALYDRISAYIRL